MHRKEWGTVVVNRKPTGTAKSMPAGLAMGWVVSLGMTAGACGVLAWLILNEKAGWEVMGYGAILTLMAAAYAGAGISCRLIQHRKMLICALSGVLYLVSLTAITALLFGGKPEGIWLTALLTAGGSGTAAVVHCAEKREKRKGRKKRRL